MRKSNTNILVIVLFGLITVNYACSNDDSRSCTTCSSPETLDFELCEESNGNASVNGENTGTPYAEYLDNLLATGTTCSN